MRNRDTSKNCYCYTCKKEMNSLGVARHRAMHRDKKEKCRIQMSDGNTYTWNYDQDEKT